MAKVLSIIAKIFIARKISTLAMSVYSLTIPTLSLLLNFAQLGIPTTVSKLIAKKKYSIFKIMQVSLLILLLIDTIVGGIYIAFVPTIANQYLKNELTTLTLYGMVLLLPLISLTSLLKGYFIGIDKIEKTSFCQISEEISRLLFIVLIVEIVDKNNISVLSFVAMFSSIIGEIASLVHLIISLNVKDKNTIKRFTQNNHENFKISKQIIKFSLMSTSTKMIGSIIYFFEPIIYTNLMIKSNVNKEMLTIEYGTVNSYVFPLLLLPTFFSNCISTYMLPKLSKNISDNNYINSKRLFFKLTIISFSIGLLSMIIIFSFPKLFTNILYGKEIGIEYIKKYSLFLSIYFIQMPIHMALIAFDKEKSLLIESILCNIIRVTCFFIFIPIFKTDGMIISIIISIYLSCIIHIFTLFKCFRSLKEKSQFSININT
ncbi:MAG: oligosaccharide flippase family protein [Bacilli bacterium]|nr:oligosaccharide flippase family protein [Bacilli bacterium]